MLHQLVDGEMPPDVSEERDIAELQEPIGVVDDPGAVEIPRELLTDAGQIALDLGQRQHRALRGAIGRVADHARPAAGDRDRAVAGTLEVGECHDADQAAGVQAGGCRVEALVQRQRAGVERATQGRLIRDLGQEAALAQGLQDARIGHWRILAISRQLSATRDRAAC